MSAAAPLCAAALLLSGCAGQERTPAGAGSSPAYSRPTDFLPTDDATDATGARDAGEAIELQRSYQRAVQEVLPSVVEITGPEGLGSGIVYDADGHVVTNAHVVGEEEEFEVTLATGGRPLTATAVASYPEQDLAVIRLGEVPDNLRPGNFDTSRVEVGQIVLAMGNPLGLSSSVTQGIVSAVGRSVSEGEGLTTLGDLVQTSAAINPGNSGGALADLAGRIIGIPTLAARDPQLGGGTAPGIGFAIPSTTVIHLTDQMIEYGEVRDSGRAELGVSVRTVLGEGFEPAGAAVVATAEDGPAARAGIRPGDVLVALGSEQVTDVVSLAEALAAQQPEDTVPVVVERAGEEERFEVTLGEA
ncbi:trypsin-like peptidase domain-containing protein [Streptomyces sp. ACA25]|uniref:S1C family serine protease n=1 Tax=Streptomyces sp. ACA25 TaxID=3022596 RepID=UPI002307FB3D|nr:trypsin-like peptidase domain-containing protein [Streptomyces sp. ACA25]MDB1089943.1 trypsin-like peptidase domain-containing protein [Streptomyces sp. ACA25]